MGGDEGVAECVEHARARLFLVEVGGSDVGELVVGECDVECSDEQVERLSGRLTVDGPEGCHFRPQVEVGEEGGEWG